MKISSKFKKKLEDIIDIIWIIIPISGIIYFIFFSVPKRRERRKSLVNKGGFAIGMFETRTRYGSSSGGHFVSFHYSVNHLNYSEADFSYNMDSGPADEVARVAKRNDKFLVLYDKTNPKDAIIRLDYSIKDSTDFKVYVKQFKQKRRQQQGAIPLPIK